MEVVEMTNEKRGKDNGIYCLITDIYRLLMAFEKLFKLK